MAPRDLPGLYWDDDKKRYFPLASRPAGTPSRPPAPPGTSVATLPPKQLSNRRRPSPRTDSSSPPRKRRHALKEDNQEEDDESEEAPTQSWNVWHSLNAFRESPLGTYRRTCIHQIQIGKLSKPAANLKTDAARVQFDGPVTALCAKSNDKLLIGDATGWLYSVQTDDPGIGMREFGLRTQITSITRSGPVCMITSLGSPARLLITREGSMGLWVLRDIPPTVCNDVWCGQVRDRKAIVGGRRAAICFPDVERDGYVRLPRVSDVLALCQCNEVITFMGMRNGVVDRWDSRQPGVKTDLVVNMAERPSPWKMTPTIDYIRIVHGHELLVRTMRGDLETHDLRFLGNTPLLQFPGFSPSFDSKLGITVDPSENFVFSGAGDKSLRIWSLRTGQALPARNEDTILASHESQVLGHPDMSTKMAHHIRALEIVESDSEVALWMAFADRLDRLVLGPKGLLL
ncbi:hypothetical protein LXA43DRAFT_96038 [Ganoderma leucocontextum]|nr:hypothetical protein LXA43DRAFT_96038 [Ganoderma leucocontextum]